MGRKKASKHTDEAITEWLDSLKDNNDPDRVLALVRERTREAAEAKDPNKLPTQTDIRRALGMGYAMTRNILEDAMDNNLVRCIIDGVRKRYAAV